MTEASGHGFSFLFRRDQGVVDRPTWWRGTLGLAVVGGLAVLGWIAVQPYTVDALRQPPALALLGYLYLLAFSFGIILLLICSYNLSAKRFTARGRPKPLAAVFPAALLGAAALGWYAPRAPDILPPWTPWVGVAAVVAVALWTVVELGLRNEP